MFRSFCLKDHDQRSPADRLKQYLNSQPTQLLGFDGEGPATDDDAQQLRELGYVLTPRYDGRHGEGTRLNFWYVLASANLRELVYRKLRQLYPELNYCVYWNDVHGYGIEMTVCSWVAEGCFHFSP